MSIYQKQHYKDVAGIIQLRHDFYHSYETRLALKSTAEAFAVLFATDNKSSFDREAFLKACGLDS